MATETQQSQTERAESNRKAVFAAGAWCLVPGDDDDDYDDDDHNDVISMHSHMKIT